MGLKAKDVCVCVCVCERERERERERGRGLNSSSSGENPVTGSCEQGNEPSALGVTSTDKH
jgi:hypothetical protein